jgi:hypothetical protein
MDAKESDLHLSDNFGEHIDEIQEREHLEKQILAREEKSAYRAATYFLLSICICLCLLTPFIGFGMVRLCDIPMDDITNWSAYVAIYIFFGVVTLLCLAMTVIGIIMFGSAIVCCIPQLYSIYTNYKVNREREIYENERTPLL